MNTPGTSSESAQPASKCHTISGMRTACSRKLRAGDAVADLTFSGVTCPKCLAPKARNRAETILRNDIEQWGSESIAWPFRAEFVAALRGAA